MFLRKNQDLTKTIIDQFLFSPILVNYLRKLCIVAYVAIWNN